MLRINALGRLVVLGGQGPILGSAAQPRRMALLAVIARAGARGVTRMKVVSLLWPDSDEEHGRGVLSKALSALRRDLGAEDVFLGTNNDLRLNPAVVSSDLGEFDAAVAVGQWERAASLYVGPFLDGFRVAGATDFEQWAATERAALARSYVSAVGDLASAATARAEHAEAAKWWGKLTACEPLNTRHASGLMRALVAAGEPRAALQHARMYELLVAESLDVPADREVIVLAEQIRAAVSSGADVALGGPADDVADAEPASVTPVAPGAPATRSGLWRVAVGLVAATGLLAAGMLYAGRGSTASGPAIALGRIIDHRVGASNDLTTSLIDALTDNLVRDGTVRVVRIDRAREILGSLSSGGDVEGALLAAARAAGATELVEGGVYPGVDGRLRLDLRRTDLTSGTLRAVRSVSGPDPFFLADSAATHLVTAMGAANSHEQPSDVSTRSYPAHRHYDAGLRAYYQGDVPAAAREFDAAVAADSSFAMAVLYGALAVTRHEGAGRNARLQRAVTLAKRAPDRERLTINAHWAHASSSPTLPALADTLVTRFPHEPDGHLFTALGLMAAGRFLDARVPLERAIAIDAAAVDGSRSRCVACDALTTLISAYLQADSLAAAERTARAWVRLAPASALAREKLAAVLARQATPH